ncbi:MAG: ABC transporter permease [Mediterranea sp.]|jgi:hypothetical protein|nr:ABC transporter permease [Mediterranea sp.]
MIRHYLKLAFRNLWKYRMQNAISIVGLAVGFACFALANLWIHYEMTYDQELKNLDRTYILYRKLLVSGGNTYETRTSCLTAKTLRSQFPEVEASCGYTFQPDATISNTSKEQVKVACLVADSAYLSINPEAGRLIQGSIDFLQLPGHIALTEKLATKLFGNARQALGETVTLNGEAFQVEAILRTPSEHSNLYFDCWRVLKPDPYYNQWGVSLGHTLVRLQPGTDVQAFTQKMRSYTEQEPAIDDSKTLDLRPTPTTPPAKFTTFSPFKESYLMPFAQFHYSEINTEQPIRILYLYLFSATGILVIACALINYLSLFVVRMRTRMREIELRRICGSSTAGLFRLFSVEYLLSILLSGMLGFVLIEWALPGFRRLSHVSGNVYGEALLYFVAVLLLSLLCLLPFVLRRQRRTFKGGGRLIGAKWSLWLQLFICLLLIFCIGVMQKQLHFLSAGDLGWDRHNTAVLEINSPAPDSYDIANKAIGEMPFVTEYTPHTIPLFPTTMSMHNTYGTWDGKQAGDPEEVSFNVIPGFSNIGLYHLKLVAGVVPPDDAKDQVLVNETAVRQMGMTDPIGKRIGNEYTIAGVLKDFYILSPTLPIEPMLFMPIKLELFEPITLIKYKEGAWNELRQRIDSVCAPFTPYPGVSSAYELTNVEEAYDKMLASEYMLLRLLGITSIVCVLVSMFGVFSLVSLSCERRRKEIAIRKVNGARLRDILALFGREYLILLVSAAVVAFPIGYALMKWWLQSYTKQVPIGFTLYPLIFLAVALLIALCIGWRVWQAARSNPADTIKAE